MLHIFTEEEEEEEEQDVGLEEILFYLGFVIEAILCSLFCRFKR